MCINFARRHVRMDQLEEYFDEYLETQESEEIFSDLFSAIRKAFIAGYKAGKNSGAKKEGRIIKLQLIDNTALVSDKAGS